MLGHLLTGAGGGVLDVWVFFLFWFGFLVFGFFWGGGCFSFTFPSSAPPSLSVGPSNWSIV